MNEYRVIFYFEGQRRGDIVIAFNDSDARAQIQAEFPGATIVTVTR